MTYSNSLKSYLYFYIKSKYPEVVNGGDIEKYAMNAQYKASNASRRCRELWKDGYIERDYVKSLSGVKCVVYKWKPPVAEKTGEERTKELAQLGIF